MCGELSPFNNCEARSQRIADQGSPAAVPPVESAKLYSSAELCSDGNSLGSGLYGNVGHPKTGHAHLLELLRHGVENGNQLSGIGTHDVV